MKKFILSLLVLTLLSPTAIAQSNEPLENDYVTIVSIILLVLLLIGLGYVIFRKR